MALAFKDTRVVKPGVYQMTNEEYHNGPGISRSALKALRETPLHYWDKYLNPDKPIQEKADIINISNALEFGNAFHSYVLEPDEFEKKYAIFPKVSRATIAGKKLYAEMSESGRTLIAEETFESITKMTDNIKKDEFANALISDGVYEHSLFWEDKQTGILCKVRPDIWHSNMIVDLKTSASANEFSFGRDIFEYDYHIQAAMIHEALYNLYGHNITKFFYVAVEKKRPYAVGIHELDELVLQKGLEDFRSALIKLQFCQYNDSWPGYGRALIGLPKYLRS